MLKLVMELTLPRYSCSSVAVTLIFTLGQPAFVPNVYCTSGESCNTVSDDGDVLTLALFGEYCYGDCLGCGFSPTFDRTDSVYSYRSISSPSEDALAGPISITQAWTGLSHMRYSLP
jgi:hypothetical protein